MHTSIPLSSPVEFVYIYRGTKGLPELLLLLLLQLAKHLFGAAVLVYGIVLDRNRGHA